MWLGRNLCELVFVTHSKECYNAMQRMIQYFSCHLLEVRRSCCISAFAGVNCLAVCASIAADTEWVALMAVGGARLLAVFASKTAGIEGVASISFAEGTCHLVAVTLMLKPMAADTVRPPWVALLLLQKHVALLLVLH